MLDAPLVRPPRPKAVRMAAWPVGPMELPAWAPPAMVALGKSSGRKKELGFLGLPTLNFDDTTVFSAAIGGVGLLFSGAFDPPLDVFVKIGGIGALAFSVYHMLGGGGPTAAQTAASITNVTSTGPTPPASVGDLSAITGTVKSPQNGQDSPILLPVFGRSYDVSFELSNSGSSDVNNVPLKFAVAYDDENGKIIVENYLWNVANVPANGSRYYTQTVQVNSNEVYTKATATLYIGDRAISPTVTYIVRD